MIPDDDCVVVIGSGPCGAVAAHQLVERGVRVRMLDAGAGAPGGAIIRVAGNVVYRRRDWATYQDLTVSAPSDRRVAWIRSHSLGGLSNHWTAAVPRFAPEDFTDGARLDERFDWPIRYDDLVPYYERAEAHLNVTAGESIVGLPDNRATHRYTMPSDWSGIAAACAQDGAGLGPIPLAQGDPWMIAARGSEFGSYHCVLKPMESNPLFELTRDAYVTKLIWSSTESRVSAVEYVDTDSGETVRLPASRVVLAAGAIDSTMILLRSTSSDFPDGLGNAHGVLGHYIHDHPREWWSAELSRPMRALRHPLYLVRQAYDEAEPLLATSHTIGLVKPSERLRTYVRAKTSDVGVQVFGTMVPDPDFTVTLNDDPQCRQPVVTMTYDDSATKTIVAARQRLQDVLGAAGLEVKIPGPFHELIPGGSVHMAGSVRMHTDPNYGVLDRWNRVHQAPDVVVCDMSAFTTGPEKNPTLTAMAIAIRAADRMADEIDGGALADVGIEIDP